MPEDNSRKRTIQIAPTKGIAPHNRPHISATACRIQCNTSPSWSLSQEASGSSSLLKEKGGTSPLCCWWDFVDFDDFSFILSKLNQLLHNLQSLLPKFTSAACLDPYSLISQFNSAVQKGKKWRASSFRIKKKKISSRVIEPKFSGCQNKESRLQT